MKNQYQNILNGNQAAAYMAYKTNEVCAIYPITPASEMSELVEEWSADQQENIFGNIPSVFEMQSEAGVAGAMHGALQTGALSTTFTASQGLLLMIPNMYKIAGELTPNVIHVATRAIATHALSVFGDHSDIMAARNTGYAFLGSSSVQEAMDLALISQTASLASRIPFVHFFDGFRTSHESAKIEMISDQVISTMVDKKMISAHRNRALNPDAPVIRGTSQGPDVFFQSREATNPYYNACPEIVQIEMNKFFELTGRQYRLFDYVGHPKAEHMIVAMASATETIEETIKKLNANGERIGLIKVRLFRPFNTERLINSIPSTSKSIAVLDRTKEPGSAGEPLYLDVLQSLYHATDKFENLPRIVGGRYGLSSKEFTPIMVKAIVDNLKLEKPKNGFTIGIQDDISHTSLICDGDFHINTDYQQALFYETKTNKTNDWFNQYLKSLGEDSNIHVQGYVECDYKKSSSRSVSHLRTASCKIKAPYLITNANFTACDSISFLKNDSVLENTRSFGKVLVHSESKPTEFWNELSLEEQTLIQTKKIELYIVNTNDLSVKMEERSISGLHACHMALTEGFLNNESLDAIRKQIHEVDTSMTSSEKTVLEDDVFSKTLLGRLLAQKGNEIPVSMMPVDGTYQSNTSKFNVRDKISELPIWDTDLCTQCGACSMACPQGALRIKAYTYDYKAQAPEHFKSVEFEENLDDFDLLSYTVQVNPDQCTSCNNCVDACPVKALVSTKNKTEIKREKEHWEYFKTIPEFNRTKIDVSKISQQQLQEPLFKYAMGVDGCGEAPYLKLASQLFGDRMVVANATGASSIFGGALPTTPWSKNQKGRGPAWSNSLFEDNAEFGLGMRLSLDQQEVQARNMLQEIENLLDVELVQNVLSAEQNTETQIALQRTRIEKLKKMLDTLNHPEAKFLRENVDSLVKKSVWIMGGDGWAYDIGYGGLDHVMASGKNVNVLVVDNEVYSNTGGQMSKATPFGASAKFAARGKQKQKKDLGLLAMNYDDVYVASVAIGANQEQTLKAFVEAEQHDGPSLIIAYCHSPAHGIDMKHPSQYHKAAVASGQWLLYRNNPNRKAKGLSPMQLDSETPTLPIEEYFRMEKRFKVLFEKDLDIFETYIKQAQSHINQRFTNYKLRELMGKPVFDLSSQLELSEKLV
ncbi:4Fe-4S binding protein [Flagellimonas pacifica]|uniref:Pyruvate-ferredoxin/flavodoxin oxidoreductase n=1 Tax=Flagellimonas pacifica TaxID=1247520 RepID=A0A285MTH8_9FLAO|nr:4Fe-4S binding protein [Allomuricauda parva]SNZ00495.1 pyruvate-ferredoxin/flavodoxin oxidoreductase [Allomuricauda parva]